MKHFTFYLNQELTVKLNSTQLNLLTLIGKFGFVNYEQLNLLWSIINRRPVHFSNRIFASWLKSDHLLKTIDSSDCKAKGLLHKPYFLTETSVRNLKKLGIKTSDPRGLSLNCHNEQANETVIQGLFAACFSRQNFNYSDQPFETLLANPSFKLGNYDLSSFAQRVSPQKRRQALYYPDEMITFKKNGFQYELYVELDNRTEGLETQMVKILNYFGRADHNIRHHKKIKIMLVMAITDGSLKSARFKTFKPVFARLANEINKIPTWQPVQTKATTLKKIYSWEKSQMVLCLTGVNEAYQDIADFLNNRSYISETVTNSRQLAQEITKKSNWRARFLPNKNLLKETSLGYWDNLDTQIGDFVFRHKMKRTKLTQPVYLEIEHSFDSFLRLQKKENSLLIFPQRDHKLFIPISHSTAKSFSATKLFYPNKQLLIQPTWGYDQSVKTLIWTSYLLKSFQPQIYSYFRTGAINKRYQARHRTNLFDQQTEYVHPSKESVNAANSYLTPYGIQLNTKNPLPYKRLHYLAMKENRKQFMKKIYVQDVPLRVYTDLLINLGMRADDLPTGFYLAYLDKPTLFNRFRDKKEISVNDWLTYPDAVKPDKRTVPKIKRFWE